MRRARPLYEVLTCGLVLSLDVCVCLQVYKAFKNDGNKALGIGCPVPNGPNQDCMATVLCNQYTLLTFLDCNDKWSSNVTARNAARAAQECWRCGK